MVQGSEEATIGTLWAAIIVLPMGLVALLYKNGQDHMLRLIDKAIDWSFIYDLVEDKYSSLVLRRNAQKRNKRRQIRAWQEAT